MEILLAAKQIFLGDELPRINQMKYASNKTCVYVCAQDTVISGGWCLHFLGGAQTN